MDGEWVWMVDGGVGSVLSWYHAPLSSHFKAPLIPLATRVLGLNLFKTATACRALPGC